jgi:hypothetical protein
MSADEDSEPLIIDGRPVDPGLLEARPMRRCRVDECDSYCCSGGVWIHTRQAEDILEHRAEIIPHLPPERRDPAHWFDGSHEADDDLPGAGPVTGTRVIPDSTHPVGETCIFLLPDRRCALQAAGVANGEHPWRYKPFYCALHPLVMDSGVLALGEGSEMYQEGGSCNRLAPDQFIPLYQLFEPEVKLALGEAGYAELDSLARSRNGRNGRSD